jgi:hypothetical protein
VKGNKERSRAKRETVFDIQRYRHKGQMQREVKRYSIMAIGGSHNSSNSRHAIDKGQQSTVYDRKVKYPM